MSGRPQSEILSAIRTARDSLERFPKTTTAFRASLREQIALAEAELEAELGCRRVAFATHGFAVVVVRHPDGRFLAVDESKGRGWWLPAGHVDRGQSFLDAAHAETWEEGGIEVNITGVLAVEHTLGGLENARMRVVFLAEPRDPTYPPKSVPDSESNGAAWLTLDEIEAKSGVPPPEGLRGRELLHWGKYVEAGGAVGPAGMLQEENEGPCNALKAQLRDTTRGGEGKESKEGKTGEDGAAAGGVLDEASVTEDHRMLRRTKPRKEQKQTKPAAATAAEGEPADGACPDADLLRAAEAGDRGLGGPNQLEEEDQLQASSELEGALSRGANVAAQSNPKCWTALHLAVNAQHLGNVRRLLLAGADPNSATHKKRTPLHMAVQRPSIEIARLLLVAGADSSAVDFEGKTVTDWARSDAHTHLLALAAGSL